jgi:hypothetical protein
MSEILLRQDANVAVKDILSFADSVPFFFQDWSLKILRISVSDSGSYKCQANSHPPQFITTTLRVQGEMRCVGADIGRQGRRGRHWPTRIVLSLVPNGKQPRFWGVCDNFGVDRAIFSIALEVHRHQKRTNSQCERVQVRACIFSPPFEKSVSAVAIKSSF